MGITFLNSPDVEVQNSLQEEIVYIMKELQEFMPLYGQ